MQKSASFHTGLTDQRYAGWLLFAWALLSFFALRMMFAGEIQRKEQIFKEAAHDISTVVHQKLLANEAVLSGFSAFLLAVDRSDEISASRYAQAVIAAHPHIYMLEVARRLTRAEQAAFEQAMRSQRWPDYRLRSFSEVTGLGKDESASPIADAWPIVFMYPQLPSAADIFGVRLETVPHLRDTQQRAARSGKAVATPPFELMEGGPAYILLRDVQRAQQPASGGQPNLFGSHMQALLLTRTTSLLPNESDTSIDIVGTFRSTLEAQPEPVFHRYAAPDHWIDRMLLPRFSLSVDVGNETQLLAIAFSRQLRWTDILNTNLLAISGLLAICFVLLYLNVRRHFATMRLAAAAHEKVEYLAMHDALTTLPNRHLLADRVEQALYRQQRHGSMFALMVIDLDHFKDINDGYGHEAGDTVLIEVSRRIQQTLRASDTVARHGGDEFIVLIADVLNREDALSVGQKLCTILSEPLHCPFGTLHISCSLGIALCPDDGEDFNALRQKADRAMYQVKDNGRNGAQLAESSADAG